MKKIFVALLLSILTVTVSFAGSHILQQTATNMDVKQTLVLNQEWVPYPAYSDRAGWDELLGEYKDSLIANGEKYLDNDWLVLRLTDYLAFNRTGSRTAQERRIFQNAKALSSLMIAELAEGKGRFMDDIMNGTFQFCEYTSWALSAHLGGFQKIKSPVPDYTDNVMALYQGNYSQMLAWIYYFFHKEFDKEDELISKRLEYELRRRELDPFLERNDYDWQAFNPGIIPNNWNPWCNSNAIICFMLMENDPDRLYEAVMKTIRSVDLYINFLASDGACDEGPVYWYVSAGNLVNYLECLSLITGGKLTIWDAPIIRDHGEYIVNANITGNWQANFADAAPYDVPSASKIFRYGVDVNSGLMKSYAVHCRDLEKFNPAEEDWARFYNAIEALKCNKALKGMPDGGFKPSTFTWYPETELCFMRSGKGIFAGKGGHNKERHNHNDVGTFIYFYDDMPVIVDAGPGTYNRDTFNKYLRYKVWNMSSLYHNVPQMNGCAEAFGREYEATGSTADKRTKTFTTDIARTFPDSAAVESCKLSYKLLKDGALDITGSYSLKSQPSSAMELHYLVPKQPDLSVPGKVGLNAGVTMKYDSSVFDASFEEIPIKGYGSGMNKAFGDTLYRLTLKEKTPLVKGSYHIMVVSQGLRP